jgi:hypothetical protein
VRKWLRLVFALLLKKGGLGYRSRDLTLRCAAASLLLASLPPASVEPPASLPSGGCLMQRNRQLKAPAVVARSQPASRRTHLALKSQSVSDGLKTTKGVRPVLLALRMVEAFDLAL